MGRTEINIVVQNGSVSLRMLQEGAHLWSDDWVEGVIRTEEDDVIGLDVGVDIIEFVVRVILIEQVLRIIVVIEKCQ